MATNSNLSGNVRVFILDSNKIFGYSWLDQANGFLRVMRRA